MTDATPWFIDAIDARGGLAVATQRKADLSAASLQDSGASVFISPPFFVPEFVATRMTGFALARGHGQIGLFSESNEVPFNSLEALAEFVRRVYVRGSGGDGGAQNGGLAPPLAPEGGEPRGEGLDHFEVDREWDPVQSLRHVAQMNEKIISALYFGNSEAGFEAPPPGGAATPATWTGARRLARGALYVLRELTRRAQAKSGRLRWLTAVERLLSAIWRMGLWPILFDELHRRHGVKWVFGGEVSTEDSSQRWLFEVLSDPHLYPGWDYRRGGGLGWQCDAFEDLILFPAPPQLVPFAPTDGRNLQALLSATTATLTQSVSDDESAECALFAAARLVLAEESMPHIPYFDLPLCEEFAEDLADKAYRWLAANIPKFVFSEKVEDIIVGASGVFA